MYRIRRFGVIRTATVVAVMYAIVFAIIFIPIALLALAAGPRGGVVTGPSIALFMVVLLVVYPLLIWVFTAIACLLYNLAARFVGGIEVEVERPPQMWTQSPGWTPQPQPGWGSGPGGGPGIAPGAGPGTGPSGWTPPPGPGSTPAAPPYRAEQGSWQPQQESWRPPGDSGSGLERPPSDPGDRR